MGATAQCRVDERSQPPIIQVGSKVDHGPTWAREQQRPPLGDVLGLKVARTMKNHAHQRLHAPLMWNGDVHPFEPRHREVPPSRRRGVRERRLRAGGQDTRDLQLRERHR